MKMGYSEQLDGALSKFLIVSIVGLAREGRAGLVAKYGSVADLPVIKGAVSK